MSSFSREDTFNKVAALVKQKLNLQDGQVIAESATLQDLGADSLAMAEILMELQEQFRIEIKDEDAEKFCSVGDMVNYVHALRTK